jgi:hypothetical protein
MVALKINGGKGTIVKIKGKGIKELDKLVYLGCVVEKNGKIQTEINKRNGKASTLYHLANSLLWNEDIDRKCKITIFNMNFKRCYCKGQRHGQVLTERKVKYKELR